MAEWISDGESYGEGMEFRTSCVVVGGGPAGYGAALAAARGGAKVSLIERHGYLGGMGGAAGLSAFINYHLDGIHDLSESIYQELIARLKEDGGWYSADEPHVDFFDIESLKSAAERSLEEAGVRVLYHCMFDTIEGDGDGYVLRFVAKGGEVKVRATHVIDTTGDADVCAKLGVEVAYGKAGRPGDMQPMTMVVQLGGFDPAAYGEAGGRLHDGRFACEGCTRAPEIARARAAGDWTIPREDIAMWWTSPRDPAHVTVNGTRIQGFSGCDPEQLSRAEKEGRRQARELAAFFKRYVPGFARSYLLATGPQIGVRETRRIVGLKTLTTADVVGSVRPADSVTYCSYPIDIHSSEGSGTEMTHDQRIHYGIPFGCLVPRGYTNILAAGRCISASHAAAGSFRVMSTCMSLGQAAGAAAGLSISSRTPVEHLRGEDVRAAMSDGAVLQCA